MGQENENKDTEDTEHIEYEGLVGCVRKLYENMPAFRDYTPPRRRVDISR